MVVQYRQNLREETDTGNILLLPVMIVNCRSLDQEVEVIQETRKGIHQKTSSEETVKKFTDVNVFQVRQGVAQVLLVPLAVQHLMMNIVNINMLNQEDPRTIDLTESKSTFTILRMMKMTGNIANTRDVIQGDVIILQKKEETQRNSRRTYDMMAKVIGSHSNRNSKAISL